MTPNLCLTAVPLLVLLCAFFSTIANALPVTESISLRSISEGATMTTSTFLSHLALRQTDPSPTTISTPTASTSSGSSIGWVSTSEHPLSYPVIMGIFIVVAILLGVSGRIYSKVDGWWKLWKSEIFPYIPTEYQYRLCWDIYGAEWLYYHVHEENGVIYIGEYISDRAMLLPVGTWRGDVTQEMVRDCWEMYGKKDLGFEYLGFEQGTTS